MKRKTRVTLANFNSIVDVNLRAKLLKEAGSFIDERIIYGKYSVKIYAMFGFLGEVWTNLNQSIIEKVVALPNGEDFELFLSRTKLTDTL